jgi:hypothetical protein
VLNAQPEESGCGCAAWLLVPEEADPQCKQLVLAEEAIDGSEARATPVLAGEHREVVDFALFDVLSIETLLANRGAPLIQPIHLLQRSLDDLLRLDIDGKA